MTPWSPPNLSIFVGSTVNTGLTILVYAPKEAFSVAESYRQLAGDNRPSEVLGLLLTAPGLKLVVVGLDS